MRVAIDISQIVYGTGVSHYRENLVKNLLNTDLNNSYLLYAGAFRRKNEILSLFPQTKVFPIPPKIADFIWNKLHILPIEKLIGKFDIVHTSDWAEPPSIYPKVTTIHDLAPLVLPKLTSKIIIETHKRRLNWVVTESKKIIVPSIATKSDLIKLGVNEEKIKVIYEAPNLTKATSDLVVDTKKKYFIREDYLIMIGTNKRKNIENSIKAYHLAKHGKNLKLLIVGDSNGIKIENERGVRFLGFIPDTDLSALLTGAKLLLFPSFYEGLGVPILDAFNCEVPVVTSNVSSLPEASGGASILVDPYDVNSIAEGIEEALNKPKTLIAKGLKVVKNFSWEKNAKETLEVYKEVNEQNNN